MSRLLADSPTPSQACHCFLLEAPDLRGNWTPGMGAGNCSGPTILPPRSALPLSPLPRSKATGKSLPSRSVISKKHTPISSNAALPLLPHHTITRRALPVLRSCQPPTEMLLSFSNHAETFPRKKATRAFPNADNSSYTWILCVGKCSLLSDKLLEASFFLPVFPTTAESKSRTTDSVSRVLSTHL